MILAYDTETTGFANLKAAPTALGQPDLVQLAAALVTPEGMPIVMVNLIVRPDDFTIPPSSSAVHGITQEMALAVGIPRKVVVACFTNLRARATATCAHNEEFDSFIMKIAMAKAGAVPSHPGPQRNICTAQESATLVGIPATAQMIKWGRGHQNKTPNLAELYKFLFNETFDGAHNALNDMRALIRCLVELRRRGVCL